MSENLLCPSWYIRLFSSYGFPLWRPFCLYKGNPYIRKTIYLYHNSPHVFFLQYKDHLFRYENLHDDHEKTLISLCCYFVTDVISRDTRFCGVLLLTCSTSVENNTNVFIYVFFSSMFFPFPGHKISFLHNWGETRLRGGKCTKCLCSII